MKKIILLWIAGWIISANIYAQLPIGFSAGLRAGVLTKNNDAFAGAQVELKVPFLTLVPNYELIFVKDLPTHTVNMDVQYNIINAVVSKMFVGGGYVMQSAKPEGAKRYTHSGFNVQVGARTGFGPMGVFAMAKYVRVKKSDTFGLAAGINYNLL